VKLVFILGGIAVLWLLPGLAAAITCLVSPRLRQRVLDLHQHALGLTILQHARSPRASPKAIAAWQWAARQRLVQLILISVVLTLSGPIAILRIRDLARAGREIRPE